MTNALINRIVAALQRADAMRLRYEAEADRALNGETAMTALARAESFRTAQMRLLAIK